MSIASVRQEIQDINLANFASVTYSYANGTATMKLRTAPDEMPNTIDASELPCALVFAGPAEWLYETFGPDGEACKRDYLVKVYVGAVGQGIDGENYAKAEALLHAMANLYLTKCDLDGSVFATMSITDTGVIADERIAYAGQQYIGFIITLRPETWE